MPRERIKLGHCEVFEDLNKMSTAQVQFPWRAAHGRGDAGRVRRARAFIEDGPWASIDRAAVGVVEARIDGRAARKRCSPVCRRCARPRNADNESAPDWRLYSPCAAGTSRAPPRAGGDTAAGERAGRVARLERRSRRRDHGRDDAAAAPGDEVTPGAGRNPSSRVQAKYELSTASFGPRAHGARDKEGCPSASIEPARPPDAPSAQQQRLYRSRASKHELPAGR